LTSFDETSAAEFPSPGLDPEKFLQYEAGVKARGEGWNAHASWWFTQIFGAIVPSPTGQSTPSGTPIVVKDNIGDGWNQGADIDGAWNFWNRFTFFGWFAWQEGEIDQTVYPAAGSPFVTRSHISRAMPISALLGVKYASADGVWYAEGVARGATDADKLSFKDKTDTQRIPPGGTPGFLVGDLRGGVKISEGLRLSAAIENIGDANYRIHGSGTNEVGINFVLGIDIRF
jgi:hemoglobin/transferrin/lactoferrin receptor protein